jgi:phage gpG-like protein
MGIVEGFSKYIEDFEEKANELPEIVRPFAVKAVQQNIDRTTRPKNAPLTLKLKGNKPPLSEFGHLRASIASKMTGDRVIVGTNLKQARMLHFGGVIKPKKSKKLAIPATKKIRKEVALLGVRGFLKQLKRQGWKIFFRDKSIMGIPPRGKKPQLLFIRKKKASIPERPFMELSEEQIRAIMDIASDALFGG